MKVIMESVNRVKKAAIAFLFSIAAITTTQAKDFSVSLANIDLGISNYPDEQGNTTDGFLAYNYTDNLQSKIRIKYVLDTKTTEEVEDTRHQLTLASSRNTDILLDPLVFTTGSERTSLSFSAGVYYGNSSSRETGHIKYSGSLANLKVQSFDNNQTLWAVGPRAGAACSVHTEELSVDLNASVIPIFYFNTTQNIDIYPLVQPAGSHEQTSTGGPFIEASCNLGILNVLGFESAWEYQKQTYELATASVNGSTVFWSYPETEIESHRLRLLGTINIKLPNGTVFCAGYGRKLGWTWQNGKTEDLVSSNNHIVKLSVSR